MSEPMPISGQDRAPIEVDPTTIETFKHETERLVGDREVEANSDFMTAIYLLDDQTEAEVGVTPFRTQPDYYIEDHVLTITEPLVMRDDGTAYKVHTRYGVDDKGKPKIEVRVTDYDAQGKAIREKPLWMKWFRMGDTEERAASVREEYDKAEETRKIEKQNRPTKADFKGAIVILQNLTEDREVF